MRGAEALEVLEAARCLLFCMLEAVGGVLCLLEVPEGDALSEAPYAGGRGPRALCA